MIPRYQTLLMDADRTLFDFERSEAQALERTLRDFSLPFSQEILKTYIQINEALWRKLELGEVSRERLQTARFKGLLETLGTPGEPDKLNERYVEHLGEGNFLLPGALEVCRRLSETCKLVLVTNGLHKAQTRRFQTSEIAPYFSGLFISEDLGCDKPDPAFFDAVLADLNNPPRCQLLVVGDSLSSDIQGAANAGLDACWLNPKGAARPQGLPIAYEIRALKELIPIVLGE